jgi:hypothetical protein
MRIGITFFLKKESSIWSNGATQNCVFLWMLLHAAGHQVFAINGGDADATPPAMMLRSVPGLDFVRLPEVVDHLDLLIEAGSQVYASDVARVQSHGGRCVTYKVGNAYVIDNERVIHNKSAGAIFNGSRFDEVWTNPQHMRTCASYWETCYRCPVRCLPHIWEPTFIDAAIREFPETLHFGYQPGPSRKRVGIFEPNFNIVKTCTIPLLVCEQAYRRAPYLIGDVFVTNAEQLKSHLTFDRFASHLDIVRAGLASFEGRYNTPWFLAKHTDIVVAHQWENALNYAYYDALYGGYPLVHNSEMIPLGYRYDGFDATSGADALIKAMTTHDVRAAEYRDEARSFLDTTVRATSKANVHAYDTATSRLFAGRPTA